MLWQGVICVSFVLHRPDSCFFECVVPEGAGQEWTDSEGFNPWKKHVLVLLILMDFPWFVPRTVRLLCHSVLLLCTSRYCKYGWTCTSVFLISLRKFSYFLSKASTFSPVIRISISIFCLLFTVGWNSELDSIGFCCFHSLSKALKIFLDVLFELFGREQCPPIDQLSGFSFVKTWLCHLESVTFFHYDLLSIDAQHRWTRGLGLGEEFEKLYFTSLLIEMYVKKIQGRK